MFSSFIPTNSEVLVFIGAGATARLGMPSTYDQTRIFRNLAKANSITETKSLLSEFFTEPDLSKILAFLNLLDGAEKSNLEISESDIENAKIIYSNADEMLLKKRILELRCEYDWNAAKKLIKICPDKLSEHKDDLILNLYSIIDKKLLSGQSLKIQNDDAEDEILSPNRLHAARNFLILFVNMMFASSCHNLTQEKSEKFEKYRSFINSFDRIMQKEANQFYSCGSSVHSRDFYLFSTSFVSFNFDMVFSWLLMNSHYELNHHPPYIQGHPLKLWLDYGVEHRGRKLVGNKIEPTLEFTESVASRENEDDHIGTPLNRAGKFYFAHGSSNWRECPICGRMTFYFGYSENKWNYKSRELIPPFPIPILNQIDENALTKQEKYWHKNLRSDSLQCMHCGAETKASDAPMIMQTMYKSTPTSFLEEIQRNVKVSLEKARHIVLLGYRLPPDDTIWYQSFAESIRNRIGTENEAFCTVVVGYKGKVCFLYGDDLLNYVKAHQNAADAEELGVTAIQNALSIFGENKVRAWTGGIPQIFGNCTENDVKELLYPSWVNWKNTRLEKN